jgi:hypothetical protein
MNVYYIDALSSEYPTNEKATMTRIRTLLATHHRCSTLLRDHTELFQAELETKVPREFPVEDMALLVIHLGFGRPTAE